MAIRYNPLTGRPIMGGSPSRTPLAQPPTAAPHSDPNATRYQRSIVNLLRPQPVMEVNRFPYVTTLPFTVGVASLLAITKPDQLRIVFTARNDNSSPAGSFLYIAFGQNANASSAWFELPVGGQVYLDTVIPQDDVYIAGSVAGVNVVLGYANSFLQMMPVTR